MNKVLTEVLKKLGFELMEERKVIMTGEKFTIFRDKDDKMYKLVFQEINYCGQYV